MEIKNIYKNQDKFINKKVNVQGWIRFNRPSKNIGFIELTDGTNLNGIQLVYKLENKKTYDLLSKLPLFSSIEITGMLINGKNDIEILIDDVVDVSKADEKLPIGKKEHSLEFLRDNAHLRSKTKMFQSIMKIRSTASFAIHDFFHKEGYSLVNTPIITGNDAEGAGESFLVSIKDGDTFYDKQGTLTVSGQLHAECYAQALKKVYTFGPTFRAENSHTTRHASEFWMVEPEASFTDYNEMMKIAFNMIKFIVKKILNENKDELDFLQKIGKKNLIEYLNSIIDSDFKKISYKEAIQILKTAKEEKGVKFDFDKIEFGIDLSTEHEKYIAGTHFKSPVFIFDYPAEIKSFYMYKNDDGTVRGYDLIVPEIGEIIGGSQREDRYDVLIKTINEKKQDLSDLQWYIDLRKNGYAKSSGYGLGFERIVMLLTGVENIRDVIPFPRTTGKLNF